VRPSESVRLRRLSATATVAIRAIAMTDRAEREKPFPHCWRVSALTGDRGGITKKTTSPARRRSVERRHADSNPAGADSYCRQELAGAPIFLIRVPQLTCSSRKDRRNTPR